MIDLFAGESHKLFSCLFWSEYQQKGRTVASRAWSHARVYDLVATQLVNAVLRNRRQLFSALNDFLYLCRHLLGEPLKRRKLSISQLAVYELPGTSDLSKCFVFPLWFVILFRSTHLFQADICENFPSTSSISIPLPHRSYTWTISQNVLLCKLFFNILEFVLIAF